MRDLSSAQPAFRKRQLANQAAEPGQAADATGFSALSAPPGLGAAPASVPEPAPESSQQPLVLATEQQDKPSGGCTDHAEMVKGPMPTELDATAEMETDAAPVTVGVDEVPVTTDPQEAAAAPVAILMDETAADDQGEDAPLTVDAGQAVAETTPAQTNEVAAAAETGGADAASAPTAAEGNNGAAVPAAADGPASAGGEAQTGNDRVWGPVVKAQGGGPGKGKWAGVDPVNFITDEGVLSSLVQYYGFGGPSEDVVRTHLVRSYNLVKEQRGILNLLFPGYWAVITAS